MLEMLFISMVLLSSPKTEREIVDLDRGKFVLTTSAMLDYVSAPNLSLS